MKLKSQCVCIAFRKFDILPRFMSFMESQSSPQQQQEIVRFQKMKQDLEVTIQQRYAMESQLRDVEFALSEVEKEEENSVIYVAAGGLFIKKPRNDVIASTKDRKATLEMRVKSLTAHETRLNEQFEEQRKKLQASITPNR